MSYLSGFPGGDGAGFTVREHRRRRASSQPGCSRWTRSASVGARRWSLGVVLGVSPIWWAASRVQADSPGIPVRVVLYDLVAAPDLFQTLQARPGAEPGVGVLTPAVDQQTDTGDKPALIMPPPAAQAMTVPASAARSG